MTRQYVLNCKRGGGDGCPNLDELPLPIATLIASLMGSLRI